MPFIRPILILVGSLILGLGLVASTGAAPIQPFDAVVQGAGGDEVYVRSGPGQEKHYPTLKLKDGDRVHVLRKDPGGWYMIDPPPGSYSWILGRYVQKNGTQGTVTENGVLVRVGAFNSTQRDVEQIRLNRGDTVEIIGEQILDSDKGKDRWFKIQPPRGEHRWIKGSHLVELNPDGSPKGLVKTLEHKPKNIPADIGTPAKPKSPANGPAVATNELKSDGNSAPKFGYSPGRKRDMADPFEDFSEGAATAPSIVNQSEEQSIREDLKLLDFELRQILAKPKTEWDLRSQREDLLALKQLAGKSPLTPQIDQRLTQLADYEYAHEQALRAAGSAPIGPPPPPGPGASPGLAPNPSVQPRPASGSRFSGAGILHRLPKATPGTPSYVIAAPDRRILCYLDAGPGINLDQYLGQSVGLTGPRGFDPRLKNDRMRVDSLTPVRLAR